MSDSIRDARRAIARDENGEGLVHLWNALEEAKSSEDEGDLDDVASLAEKIANDGDEADQAEAERLLVEVDRARGDEPLDEVGDFAVEDGGTTVPPAEPASDGDFDESISKQKGASALWGLIGFAVFLFFLLRDVFF